MAYTFSFDASVKFTQTSNFAGYLNHFAREENEVEINHSNENIDPSRTHENLTFIFDENSKGSIKLAESHGEIMDALYKRWGDAINLEDGTYKTTGKTVRKDAVVAFGMIMQIDPQYYKDKKAEIDAKYDPKLYPEENKRTYEKLVRGSVGHMLGLARKRFGKENIVAVSLHMDETNPHIHFLMTPITDDGRLNQREFITAPKLKHMHGEFRKELREKGYDIDLERKTPVNAKRLSEKEYKELQKAKEEREKMEADKIALEAEKAEFEAYRALETQNIQARLADIAKREEELEEAMSDSYKYELSRAHGVASKIKLADGTTVRDEIVRQEKIYKDMQKSAIQAKLDRQMREIERNARTKNRNYDLGR